MLKVVVIIVVQRMLRTVACASRLLAQTCRLNFTASRLSQKSLLLRNNPQGDVTYTNVTVYVYRFF